ncbi:MAG: hypothetical protein QOE90_1861 [Thermoplasmata archaeon]|jgi:hypothetical protein|nr:hypothetical protein [Thermoplasmata archaeon]
MVGTLALSGALNLVAACAFVGTAAWFLAGLRHGLDAAARGAARSFALWWAGLGAFTAIQGAQDLLGAAGVTPLPLFVAFRYASLTIFLVAIYGLMDYTLYVRTGRTRHRPVVAAYLALAGLAVMALLAENPPVGVDLMPWWTDVAFPRTPAPALLGAILAAFSLPEIVACLSQLLLARRLEASPARTRILVVFGALLVYALATAGSRYSGSSFAQLVLRPGLGLVVALLVVLAYRPRAPRAAFRLTPTRAALEARVRELV